jgi:putative DNA primase/helicase
VGGSLAGRITHQGGLELAKSQPEIAVVPDQLDQGPWLLNVLNGTLDLQTGALREHRREDLLTKLAQVRFDPEAAAPRFMAFLEDVLPDSEVRAFVQRLAGQAATGFFLSIVAFLIGRGDNGKTVLLETLKAVLGDYAHHAPNTLLPAVRGRATPPRSGRTCAASGWWPPPRQTRVSGWPRPP